MVSLSLEGDVVMDYDIWDSFMIRTPTIPFCYLEEYRNSNKDIYEFISENEFLDNFLKMLF